MYHVATDRRPSSSTTFAAGIDVTFWVHYPSVFPVSSRPVVYRSRTYENALFLAPGLVLQQCIYTYILRAGCEWHENGSLESPATRAWTTRAVPVHGRFRWQSTTAGHDVSYQGPSQQTATSATTTTPTPKPLRKGHGRSSDAVSCGRARGPGGLRSSDCGRAPGRQRCTLYLCRLRSPVLRHTEGKPAVTVLLIVAAGVSPDPRRRRITTRVNPDALPDGGRETEIKRRKRERSPGISERNRSHSHKRTL